jgi:hypothetical protein
MGLSSYAHHLLFSILLVLIILEPCHSTLLAGEIQALTELFGQFPSLAFVDPYYQYGDQPFWSQSKFIQTVYMSNCSFQGTLPSSINAPRLRELVLYNNQLCGPLPDLAPTHANFHFNDNWLTGSIPQSWQNLSARYQFSLSSNYLNGTIPNPFLIPIPLVNLMEFDVHGNNLTGGVPDMAHFPTTSLVDFSDTNMDACINNPNQIFTSGICHLDSMESGPCGRCEGSWSCYTCPLMAAPGTTIPPSSHANAEPPQCIIPPPRNVAPLSSPLSLPVGIGCPQPIPFGFICQNGQLISFGTINTPSISFPPNSGTVIVNGSLNTATTITFTGLGSSLNVSGCVNAPDGVVIVLDGKSTPPTGPKNPVLLITQGEGCSQSLVNMIVNVEEPKSCKKTKVTNDGSSAIQLTVVFNIDSSSCNTKWIVLGSVLGSVVVILVILILIFTLNPAAKACIRPFTNRSNNKVDI